MKVKRSNEQIASGLKTILYSSIIIVEFSVVHKHGVSVCMPKINFLTLLASRVKSSSASRFAVTRMAYNRIVENPPNNSTPTRRRLRRVNDASFLPRENKTSLLLPAGAK